MKTTRNLSIRKALLSTIAVAGLVAGTAACGGKNTDSSAESDKQALIDSLLDAARTGTEAEIATIIEQADPDLVAQVLPEIDAELDAQLDAATVVAPETAVADPADPADDVIAPEESAPEVADEEVADEEVADEEVADEEVADEEVADEEVADEEVADEVTPEAEDEGEESAPESGSSGSGSTSRFPGISLPGLPSLVSAPQVEGVMFWAVGDTTKVTIMINEKSPLVQADIVEVKLVYSFLGADIVDYATQDSLVGTNVWSWIVEDSVIENDTAVTITVKNAAGKTHTYNTVATLSAPL
jgi:hypothetical protein